MSFYDRIVGVPLASEDERVQKVGPAGRHPDARPRRALLGGLRAGGGHDDPPVGWAARHVSHPAPHAPRRRPAGVVYFSYRQTMSAYPNGGGSYTVAKANLGTRCGLLAAASLMVDYILNVAVGIAAGVGALVSAVPALHPYILPLCLWCSRSSRWSTCTACASPGPRSSCPPTCSWGRSASSSSSASPRPFWRAAIPRRWRRLRRFRSPRPASACGSCCAPLPTAARR